MDPIAPRTEEPEVHLWPGERPRGTVEIVVPVFNEEADLEPSVRRLHHYLSERFPFTWLVTIADNASTDRTWGIACRLASELDGVYALHLDRKGRGRALRAAWSSSPAAVVAYMDVDLSTDLDALLPVVAPLVSGHSDMAIGTRLAHSANVVRGPKREVISRGYNLILKTALRSGFSDAQCGFKAVRAEVARTLLPMIEDEGWFFDTELLVVAEHNGLRIHEVPVDWTDDPDSRVDVARTAREDLQGIWRLVRRFARGEGRIELASDAVPVNRAPALTSQLVRFLSIGVVSTIVFAALFALLYEPLGPYLADVVTLSICALANTAANRRLTFALRGRAGRVRHYAAGLALAALPLVLTLTTLVALEAAGITTLGPTIVALTVANAMATAVRFVLMRTWVFDPGPRGRGS
jgi:putative flippase GtrA